MKTTKPRNTLILFATFTAVFLVTCNLYNQVQIANGPLLGAQINAIIPMAILSFLVASYTALSVAFFILETPLSVSLVRGTILSYVLALCFVLFGKSIGISGINPNPFQPDLISASSFLNVLVFVPAGFLLQSVLKKPQRTALIGLCGIILIEFAQFALSLGIADIIDIIANEISVLAGAFLFVTLKRCGQFIERVDGRIYFAQKKTATPIAFKTTCTAITCLAIGILAFSVFVENAKPKESNIFETNEMPLFEIESETLLKLDRAEQGATDLAFSSTDIPDFVFDKASTPTSWIASQEDGTYASKGSVDQIVSWIDSNGQRCFALTLCCREQVGDIEVVHGIPIVITKETAMTIDGVSTNLEDLAQKAFDLYTCDLECVYHTESGWLCAERISATSPINKVADDIALFDYFCYDDYLRTAENNEPFLILNEGETRTVQCHLVSITEVTDELSYCTIQFYDKMGSIPIVHSINIKCDRYIPSYPENTEDLSNLVVSSKNGLLVLEDAQ